VWFDIVDWVLAGAVTDFAKAAVIDNSAAYGAGLGHAVKFCPDMSVNAAGDLLFDWGPISAFPDLMCSPEFEDLL
jgi:hypothetical protein